MSEIPLNKFEKEKRVIELHNQGKTIRDIAQEIHMSFKDIGRIIKRYEKQQAAIASKEKLKNDSSNIKKKPPITTQAFKLFHEGKKLTDVAIELEIPAKKAVKLWSQFLKLERMYQCYEFYKDYEYDIPRLLTINNFIKNNHVNIRNIADLLKEAKNILNLRLQLSIIKYEIAELKQIKNNYLLNQNSKHQLPSLGPLPRYYNW
jgi:transposase